MRKKQIPRGYSALLAGQCINLELPCNSISTETESVVKFVDGKPTDEVIGTRAYFVQEGTEPFSVKFPNDITLPNFLAQVMFENLEACEVNNRVYFRADGIKEV